MRKLILIISVIILNVLSCSDYDNRYSVGLDDFYGVWANENCQLVKTGKYELLFERTGDKIYSSIRIIKSDEKQLYLETIGFAEFDIKNKKVLIQVKDLIKGGNVVIKNDPENKLNMSKHACKLKHYPEKILITSNGNTIGELAKINKQLRLIFPSGNWQTLELVEKIFITDANIPIKANSEHIGAALHQWRLGSTYQTHNGKTTTIEINTNKYSFRFSVNQSGEEAFAYCSAARIRSNNKGTVFAENIKLMNKADNFVAYNVSDNFETVRKELIIVDSLFKPDEYAYDNGIYYWSLEDFNDTLIVVNGSDGNSNHYRPDINAENIVEWFEYSDY